MEIKLIDTKEDSRDSILEAIADFSLKQKLTLDKNALLKEFISREKKGTTGFENGVSIPHARIKSIVKPAIVIARNESGVDWKSLDGKPTDLAIAILVPADSSAGDEHMKLLSVVTSLLMNDKNIDVFKNENLQKIKKMISTKKEESAKPKKEINLENEVYEIVAITTCPTGVAHTNMAADSLEKYCKDNKIKIKVERQAAQGTVNGLTDEDISSASLVILAAGKQIEGKERFEGKKVYETSVSAPIKSAENVIKKRES